MLFLFFIFIEFTADLRRKKCMLATYSTENLSYNSFSPSPIVYGRIRVRSLSHSNASIFAQIRSRIPRKRDKTHLDLFWPRYFCLFIVIFILFLPQARGVYLYESDTLVVYFVFLCRFINKHTHIKCVPKVPERKYSYFTNI